MDKINNLPAYEVGTDGNYYPIAELVAMKLPSMPRTKKGWYDLVARERWAYKEVPAQGGKGGTRKEYLPPLYVEAMVKSFRRGELNDLPALKARAAAALMEAEARKRGQPEHTDNLMAERAPLFSLASGAKPYQPGVPPPPTAETTAQMALETEGTTRCIVAAEKVLAEGYTRQQQVSLGVDTWGMLKRMFPEKLHRLLEIGDDDLVQLATFIRNARRAMEIKRPPNLPPLV